MNTSWSGTRESFPRPLRRAILHRDPICRHCHTRQSTIADHIIPVAEGGTDTITNGQGLCDPCHHTKTQAEDKQESSVDFDKWGNKTNVTVEKVLAANIYAGTRKHKRHEIALNRAGILPDGMGIVPGDAAKLDQYGNMTGGQIVQIVAWFKAFGEQGYKANINDKGRARIGRDKKSGQRGFAYFALQQKRGKLLPGVYQRFQTAFGSAIKPVMIFVRMPSYRKRFDFYGVADRAARKEFARAFPMYLDKLLAERGL